MALMRLQSEASVRLAKMRSLSGHYGVDTGQTGVLTLSRPTAPQLLQLLYATTGYLAQGMSACFQAAICRILREMPCHL